MKKSDHCKYLGVTIDKHLGFQTKVKKVQTNMAVGLKTVETVQHRFPTQVLFMIFHALVMRHLDYSLVVFFKISYSLLLSLKKQMICALKSVFFRSNIRSLDYVQISDTFFQYINNQINLCLFFLSQSSW